MIVRPLYSSPVVLGYSKTQNGLLLLSKEAEFDFLDRLCFFLNEKAIRLKMRTSGGIGQHRLGEEF